MRKGMWLVLPIILMVGCSKDRGSTATSPANTAPPASASARPEEGGPPPMATQAPLTPAREGGSYREPVREVPAQPRTGAADREAYAPGGPSPARNASAPVRAEIDIPRGTPLHVRLNQGLSTRANRTGDGFEATLTRPLIVNGGTVLPVGTQFVGHVTTADSSGRLKGRAVIGVTLDAFRANGREHRISTSHVSRVSQAHKKRNAFLIGGGAGLGAAIGAIAGGGKGAAIGGLAGAGAGTAGAAATGKLHAAFPPEAGLTFTTK